MNSKFPLIQNRTDKSGKDKAGLNSPRPNTTKRDNDLRFSKIEGVHHNQVIENAAVGEQNIDNQMSLAESNIFGQNLALKMELLNI